MPTRPALVLVAIPRCDPARFVRLESGLLERMASPGAAPTLLVAELTGCAALLGRFQRTASAVHRDRLDAEGRTLIRRLGGGRAVRAGEGAVGVALAAPRMDALFPVPFGADKVLNRCVRGLNAGLTLAGAPGGAHYLGRDFVSAQGRQLAIVSQDGKPEGATVFEAIVAVDASLALPAEGGAYPAHGDPRAGGPPHASLAELRQRPIGFEELVDALARGHASAHGCELIREGTELPEGAAIEPPVHEEEAGFSESGVADEPIGFVEALVTRDGEEIREARSRGDFIAPAFAVLGLERSLAGCPLTFPEIGRRVDAAFHQPGACIHGVRALRVFVEALLAAAGRLGR